MKEEDLNGKNIYELYTFIDCMMHIGREYQAQISNFNPEEKYDIDDKSLSLWVPPQEDISIIQVEEYLKVARFKYGYSIDQALAFLHWYNMNFQKALEEINNWIPQMDGWTLMDKLYFEQAYKSCGKNFRMIQHMLPEKSIGDLVSYYYTRKKLKTSRSDMDIKSKLILKYNGHQSEKDIIQNHAKILTAFTNNSSKYCSLSENLESNKKFMYESPELWHDAYSKVKGQEVIDVKTYLPIDPLMFLMFKKFVDINNEQINDTCKHDQQVFNPDTPQKLFESSKMDQGETIDKTSAYNDIHPEQLSELLFKKLEADINELKYQDRENLQVITNIKTNMPKLILREDLIENLLSSSVLVSQKNMKNDIIYL